MVLKSALTAGILFTLCIIPIVVGQSSCPVPRPDSRCGVDFDRAPCAQGLCCSRWGWCGVTADHCGAGFQDMSCTPSSSSPAPTLAPTLAPTFAPTLAPTLAPSSPAPTPAPTLAPSSPAPTPAPTLPPSSPAPTPAPSSACPAVRADGRCGKDFNNSPCALGQCCSEYGWCGTTTGHCNANTQTFNCSETPAPSSAPTPSPTNAPAPATTSAPTAACPAARSDWRCGRDFGGAPCLSGNCCSQYGYCGSSTDHCNSNSQTFSCAGTPAPTASSGQYIATEYCGNNMIALTFDDGPNFATEAVLNVLQDKNVTGTLFVNGNNWPLEGTTKCSLLQRAANLGIEIESHSHAHISFPTLGELAMYQDLETLETFLKSCGITTPVKFFRPPFGSLTKEQGQKITQQFGYVISFWNTKTDDGPFVTPAQAIATLTETMPSPSSGQGALVLLHDVAVRSALPEIIEHLKTTYPTYRFVTQKECHDACSNWVNTTSGKICKAPGSTHYQLWSWL